MMRVQLSKKGKVQIKYAKKWRRLGIVGQSKVKLMKRLTHYPVPSNLKVSKELGKIMIIFVHTKRAVVLWI